MALVELAGFVGPAYQLRPVNAASETLYNWYVQTIQSATARMPAKVVFVPTPGRRAFTTGLDGPIRGEFSQDGRMFAVAGRYLYELDGIGGKTNRGYVGTDNQPASMATNGHGANQLFVVSAGAGWVFDLTTNTLTQVTDPSFPLNVVMVVFLAGYFIVMQAGTSKFFLSDLENGLSWDATNVGQTTYSSDTLTAIAVLKAQLWLIGSQRTEVWQNVGVTAAASFPFAPILGAFSEYGTNAPWSVKEASDRLWMLGHNDKGSTLFLGTDGLFFNDEVSNYAVSQSLGQVQSLSEGVTIAYQEAGHSFVGVTFPTTGPTWYWDINERMWHQRGQWDAGLGLFTADRAICHAYAFGKHLVGDHTLGTIYEQALEFGDDDGTPIRRERTCPHLNTLRQPMFYQELAIDMEVGIGTASDPDPQMMLNYSKDAGHTWSGPLMRSFGAGGQYHKQVKWTQCGGRATDMVFRVSTTARVPPNLLNASLRVAAGTMQR